jgi:hypothetical protein
VVERELIDGRAPRSRVTREVRTGPAAELSGLASGLGNARFARLVEPGGGILAGGAVHPAVERLIAERAGRGSRLDSAMAHWAGDRFASMPAVSVHADETADALARSVSARAFTVRNDIFFAAGSYHPGTLSGRRLVAHELAHVAQQRGAAPGGPLRVTEPGDALEQGAESIASELDG